MINKIKEESNIAIKELIEIAKLQNNDLLVVGCSSSEIVGKKLGTNSNEEIAQSVFNGIYSITQEKQIELAVQCCEHLNRAVILERDVAIKRGYEIVNVIPIPKAGGAFATTAYKNFKNPVAVECVKAEAGIDIGLVMIGMQIKSVAVPVRLRINRIGEATIICARSRGKYIGGVRAIYEE